MPTYGYQCENCGKTFEVFQKVTDSAITKCSDCGGKTNKIFYPVGIIFKGSGFHITDYCRPKETEKVETTKESSDSPKEKDKIPVSSTDKKA